MVKIVNHKKSYIKYVSRINVHSELQQIKTLDIIFDKRLKLLLDLLSSNSSTNNNDGWNNYNSSTYTLEEVDKITREKTKPKPFKAGNTL